MAKPIIGIAPAEDKTADKLRTLWRANLRIQNAKQEFLFRSSEDFTEASELATRLCDESPSCEMVGAVIVGIERVARLWN